MDVTADLLGMPDMRGWGDRDRGGGGGGEVIEFD